MNRQQHYLLGYGSLISHDSRYRYTNIDAKGIPVSVSGWQRSWNMRSKEVQHTCVGALPKAGATINGVLLPIDEITPALRTRESEYHFTAINPASIEFHDDERTLVGELREAASVWICEVMLPESTHAEYPIHQSYVDTCLSGCFEHVGEEFARSFIEQTHGWQEHWVNDRKDPQYRRMAKVNKQMQQTIDDLLYDCGILHHRQEI